MKILIDTHIAMWSVFDTDKLSEMAGFRELSLQKRHVFALKTLKLSEDAPNHKDPFDRILICQAKVEGMKFLTHDALQCHLDKSCF